MAWREPLICDTVLKKKKKRPFTQILPSRAQLLNTSETSNPLICQNSKFLQPETSRPEASRENQSALCLIVISSLTAPHPQPLPVFSFSFPKVVPIFSPNILPCAKSIQNPQIWCYTFAVIIEMSISLDVFVFFNILINTGQQNKKKKERSDVVSLFSHIKTRLLIHLAFHHERWWWRTDTSGHVWAPWDHQYLESAVQHFYRHVNRLRLNDLLAEEAGRWRATLRRSSFLI